MELLNLEVIRSYGFVLLQGLGNTVLLTLIVIVLAGLLAIPLALVRTSRFWLVRLPFETFVEIIRGTPLILQLFYVYYVLPSAGVQLDPFAAAVVALTMNYTAYLSEVYRGGIKAIPVGQRNAAAALGMTPGKAFIRIILPQAFKVVTPTLGNYFIALFKDTALASVVTVNELLYTGNLISSSTYQYFTVYTVTGILYFIAGFPASLLVRYLEKRSQNASGKRRRPSPPAVLTEVGEATR
ncbi:MULTISPECIES: amino acid ABC transporter permease [unclassified Mesorhizobium]|uniref:amino acid ABC transporter permease n=1 Tax=unclassified Mesorhizobium TaxID=325217 RepID=UPI000FCA7C7F|nr:MULTISPECIES: amino acid ABC transporter permease [unclassified Mesorhizobium]TGP21454.1 amino acid ABC transporter permease [Mesorhizobium sp. M1D.F.Ca.ET.231.01.1.1]TGP28901.1 amino acid ABC transporter permease [Mesorhizobium sp. M1D.F.Ca.ET.234.01.1.1]TGS43369.1 amino acid ABC transporter permease [Mesorhizobium sp. M1D.F.Ca.ET.184.01.1.1]TGS59917.1 amino acid ABC transporter permease [Mesorhizobium sp. M1D.F.Ca.ET.183.01.1.1]